jgi:purine-binding chemotaxis protein CheW
MAEEQLVLFSLGNEEYAVSITQVKEIIQYKGATKIPSTPEYMEGVINLRGKVIPVIDLALRLDLAAAKASDKRALIIETAEREIGLVVDEVSEVVRIQDSAIEPAPPGTGNGYIRGIGKEGDRLLILLNVDHLFGEQELETIGKAG